jgi:hypothetical protein
MFSPHYNEGYYIGRTLCHQIAMKQEIFNDKNVRHSHLYLDKTEDEFKLLCQLHPKSIMH